MTADEACDFASLDTYIRGQLAKATETHAPYVDVAARLAGILEAGRKDDHDDTATADS
jgi:hypothetical protein